VKECHRIVSPYKLANKRFKPNGTEITVRGVRIGGPEVVVMAGPCSIENRDQIEISAEIVAKAGAKGIRGGAFKPRSSRTAFRGWAKRVEDDPGGGRPGTDCSW
jgi:3-deoxy-7-phosphoheptulonate synthase